MTGFAFQLAQMSGDLSVVIFGERDCANAFPRQGWGIGTAEKWSFYTADVRESDVLSGAVDDRLEECLRTIIAQGCPRPIVVLSTCLTKVLGADPVDVCERVRKETGVGIVSVDTSGLRLRTQANIVDWVARVLVGEFGSREETGKGSINVIGYQTGDKSPFRDELAGVLASLGLTLNSAVPLGAGFNDWVALPRAEISLVAEKAMYQGLLDLIDRPGHRSVEVPFPKGLSGTDRFYSAVAGLAGRDFDAKKDGGSDRGKAVEALEAARGLLKGRRIAYGLGSHHNFLAEQLAWEGMSDVPLLMEMGLTVEAVIQERDRPEVHERIKRNLKSIGLEIPYRLFDEPATLAPVLESGGYDVAYLSDFLSDQAAMAGVP
ncbi:MAG: hypothetical protein GXP54_05815, partial [Deltaproteobacteria bacterium]|nr:hypothetical protein [Deltaproteobacteria bacterium]